MGMWPFGGGKKRSVLIVDDDVSARTMLAMFFTETGWAVREASNGQLGVDMALAETPDIILLDVDMPVMTGPDALLLLRSNPKLNAVPIMMVTARGTLDDVERCLMQGANDFISKPFELLRLKAKVEKLAPAPPPAA
ncbi:MAG: response regulator [Elusimicrobia bacterium]|nr:response regulator [Elusimicrobiota bacterium]